MAMEVDEAVKRPISMDEVQNIQDVPAIFPEYEVEAAPVEEPPKKTATKDKRVDVLELIRTSNVPETVKEEHIRALNKAEHISDVYNVESNFRIIMEKQQDPLVQAAQDEVDQYGEEDR